MRGWGSSFALWLVGALLVSVGLAQFEHAGFGALVALVPGALMFGMGANALYRRRAANVLCGAETPKPALIIPFPGGRR